MQNTKHKYKRNTKDVPAPASSSWQTNLCLIFLRSTQQYILQTYWEEHFTTFGTLQKKGPIFISLFIAYFYHYSNIFKDQIKILVIQQISFPWWEKKNTSFLISGTFVLVTFGCASIAQSVLSLQNKGDFFSINWGSVPSSSDFVIVIVFGFALGFTQSIPTIGIIIGDLL